MNTILNILLGFLIGHILMELKWFIEKRRERKKLAQAETYYVRIYQDHQGQVKTQIFNTPIQSDGSDKVVEFKPKD